MISIEAFAARRARLATRMGAGVAIIPTALECVRNRDSHYPYRFDSYFYYLSGFPEPEALLVLIAGAEPRSILFCRAKNEEREIWEGFRYGPDAAREAFAIDECFNIDTLDEQMPKLLSNQAKLYFTLGADAGWDARVTGWLNAVRAQARAGVRAPSELMDLRLLIDELRLYKDAEGASPRRASAPIR